MTPEPIDDRVLKLEEAMARLTACIFAQTKMILAMNTALEVQSSLIASLLDMLPDDKEEPNGPDESGWEARLT